jgi:hypothetical protein
MRHFCIVFARLCVCCISIRFLRYRAVLFPFF